MDWDKWQSSQKLFFYAVDLNEGTYRRIYDSLQKKNST